MRTAWACLIALGFVGWLGPACSGAEFSGAGDTSGGAGSDAVGGMPTDSNGGAPDSTAGSQARGGEGGSETSAAGAGGTPAAAGAGGSSDLPPECLPDDAPVCNGKSQVATCDASGTWQVSDCQAGPEDCAPATCSQGACVISSLAPVEVAGDCKRLLCASGETANQVDLSDLPAARGPCDVPSCTEAGPVLHGDDSKCAINKQCVEGKCACRPCPYGKLDNVVADSCRMGMNVVATANKTGTGSTAAGAIDGNTQKTWNSGTLDGTLTLTFSTPETMNALVIYVTGTADNNSMGAKTVTVDATVATSGSTVTKNGTWDFTTTPTGPIRLELGAVKATKITLKFNSATSSIAVNEVLFVVCP
jgi:hypothetical protein